MNLLTKSYEQLVTEVIQILVKVKNNIRDNSDCIWTYYETPEQMRSEIDKYILELEKGSTMFLDKIYMHFAPTAAYQEHSIANGWSDEYLELAGRFDKIYEVIKTTN
ncbi:hypothetical protein [Ferruginibacter sp. SUN106]|uniref:hypothetical protein n=1 Tax=Ferruginibacter sp. SUN106 TaxID=2978348 RepID=UPI003D35B1CA